MGRTATLLYLSRSSVTAWCLRVCLRVCVVLDGGQIRGLCVQLSSLACLLFGCVLNGGAARLQRKISGFWKAATDLSRVWCPAKLDSRFLRRSEGRWCSEVEVRPCEQLWFSFLSYKNFTINVFFFINLKNLHLYTDAPCDISFARLFFLDICVPWTDFVWPSAPKIKQIRALKLKSAHKNVRWITNWWSFPSFLVALYFYDK